MAFDRSMEGVSAPTQRGIGSPTMLRPRLQGEMGGLGFQPSGRRSLGAVARPSTAMASMSSITSRHRALGVEAVSRPDPESQREAVMRGILWPPTHAMRSASTPT
jgi:hypothetical protein